MEALETVVVDWLVRNWLQVRQNGRLRATRSPRLPVHVRPSVVNQEVRRRYQKHGLAPGFALVASPEAS